MTDEQKYEATLGALRKMRDDHTKEGDTSTAQIYADLALLQPLSLVQLFDFIEGEKVQ